MTTSPHMEPHLYNDALLELGNVAFSHAATALSALVGGRVDLSTPKVRLLPSPTILDVTEGVPGEYYLAMVRVFGARQGSVTLVMPATEAEKLCTMLALRAGETTKPRLDDSILGEVANIMSGAALLAIYRFLGVSLVHGTPTMRAIKAGQASAAQEPVGLGSDLAIVVTTHFRVRERAAGGWLVISLDDIRFFLDALDRAMAGSE